MDTARQALRWSIPAWVVATGILVFQVIQNLGLGRPLSSELHHLNDLLGPGIAALAVVSGVGVGVLVYQLYYFSYGRVLLCHIVGYDSFGHVLRALPSETRASVS